MSTVTCRILHVEGEKITKNTISCQVTASDKEIASIYVSSRQYCYLSTFKPIKKTYKEFLSILKFNDRYTRSFTPEFHAL
jgi:hypothetical protein